jgi:single-stranded-DNA-specific exonuclease
MVESKWQIVEKTEIVTEIIEAIQPFIETLDLKQSQGEYIAQLLQQRGITNPQQIRGFIDANQYNPTSAFAFGEEMTMAINRLVEAYQEGEKIAIWGDFDADGITATSVLWEGLGEFFPQEEKLIYYIPNRFTQSHGLNEEGIRELRAKKVSLIVTCDTGSTNHKEMAIAKELDIDIIVTDHHTLPTQRPEVTAIINPRYFPQDHPLYHLSGVAVAYKLIEALYSTLPEIPHQPLENLLDLVAIGLIADLVALQGDCRYLAQKGIIQLQKQADLATANRPGVSKLLKLCKGNGDRPTDISFGIGPRINAVSRIHGDGHFGVELLTSKDTKKCEDLAEETELCNSRRKVLQKETLKQVKKKLDQLDLSTTNVIVLADSQWQGGILGLVAGQIAQEYGKPTVLLNYSQGQNDGKPILAKGSARSIQNINLYDLVKSQENLLHRFGGHPFAAGLSLPLENLELFTEGINQQIRQNQEISLKNLQPTITVDLTVTVKELGRDLFKELKLLEPCGMGNPVPKLLIKNCWFTDVSHGNIKDSKGTKIQYIRTFFKICDNTKKYGFKGIWWGHYQDEISLDQKYDVIVELDYDTYVQDYRVRIIDLQECLSTYQNYPLLESKNNIIDYRTETNTNTKNLEGIILNKCPLNWQEIKQNYYKAKQLDHPLTLAYSPPKIESPQILWQKLIGIAKYLSRTAEKTTPDKIKTKLNLSDRTLKLGLETLEKLGFEYTLHLNSLQIVKRDKSSLNAHLGLSLCRLIEAIQEEQFQYQYFYTIPVKTIENIIYSEDQKLKENML